MHRAFAHPKPGGGLGNGGPVTDNILRQQHRSFLRQSLQGRFLPHVVLLHIYGKAAGIRPGRTEKRPPFPQKEGMLRASPPMAGNAGAAGCISPLFLV